MEDIILLLYAKSCNRCCAKLYKLLPAYCRHSKSFTDKYLEENGLMMISLYLLSKWRRLFFCRKGGVVM